jgi:hypothetical protein
MGDLILSTFDLTAKQFRDIASYLIGTEAEVEDYLKDFGISENPTAKDVEIIEGELGKMHLAERCSECGIWMKSSNLKGKHRTCRDCINSINSYYR